jgi:hypothetical protein
MPHAYGHLADTPSVSIRGGKGKEMVRAQSHRRQRPEAFAGAAWICAAALTIAGCAGHLGGSAAEPERPAAKPEPRGSAAKARECRARAARQPSRHRDLPGFERTADREHARRGGPPRCAGSRRSIRSQFTGQPSRWPIHRPRDPRRTPTQDSRLRKAPRRGVGPGENAVRPTRLGLRRAAALKVQRLSAPSSAVMTQSFPASFA